MNRHSGLGKGSALTKQINTVKYTADGVVKITKTVLNGLGHSLKAASLGIAGGLTINTATIFRTIMIYSCDENRITHTQRATTDSSDSLNAYFK